MRLCGMHSVLSIIVLYSVAHGNGVGFYFALCRGYAAALLRRMAVYLGSRALFCTDSALPLGQGGLGVALRSVVALQLLGRRSCAAFGCVSSLVAASGGQGGIGGLRVPPRPSLDSPLPLETPPLR